MNRGGTQGRRRPGRAAVAAALFPLPEQHLMHHPQWIRFPVSLKQICIRCLAKKPDAVRAEAPMRCNSASAMGA